MNSEPSELWKFLKTKRSQTGLTQIDLAIKAGVGLRFLRELEHGKTSARMDKVNQVLMLFGHELGPIPNNRQTLMNEKS